MKNISDRQNDILSIIASLDISPSMFKNANEKYKAITKFLEECGIEADMYPQGSFAFGTVVRPSAKDPAASYDLDFICQVRGNRNDHTPSELRDKIEEALTSSKVYGGKLEVYKECFTIEYADINGIKFTSRLTQKSLVPQLIETAIAVPKYNGERNYSWLTNNPKGFKAWFDQINEPFLRFSKAAYRQSLFEQNTALFASVEEIPHELERSALQRVIQILKHHRDVYYTQFADGDDIKPISAILNAVVAQISSKYTPECSVFELLEFVLNELSIYSLQQKLTFKEFAQKYGEHTVFSRQNGKWYISNPANPEDNLADKWNVNSKIPECFFRWVCVAKTDLIDGLQLDDERQFRAVLESGFGETTVSNVLGKKYCGETPPRLVVPKTAAKPYRSL